MGVVVSWEWLFHGSGLPKEGLLFFQCSQHCVTEVTMMMMHILWVEFNLQLDVVAQISHVGVCLLLQVIVHMLATSIWSAPSTMLFCEHLSTCFTKLDVYVTIADTSGHG